MFNIKKATPDYLNSIIEGNQAIAFETEGTQLERETLSLGVSAILNDPLLGQYWICETTEGKICGQIMVTYEWSDWRNGHIWWVQSVYVWPNFRRQGVFRNLLMHLEYEAKQRGVVLLRLYVVTNNQTAHAAYSSVGFKTGTYQLFSKSIQSD